MLWEKLLAEHSTICVISENVWTNTQIFIALATLLAGLRYTSCPSAQQQWSIETGKVPPE